MSKPRVKCYASYDLEGLLRGIGTNGNATALYAHQRGFPEVKRFYHLTPTQVARLSYAQAVDFESCLNNAVHYNSIQEVI